MTQQDSILIFGAAGQLGFELRQSLSGIGPITALTRAECDVSDARSIEDAIERIRPSLIINAAAYTAVDQAESHIELATQINARAPAVMAQAATRINARLVHYSTDYVFDGTASLPYKESDASNPQSVYGDTKRKGELAVLEANPAHLVLRTSWVAGAHGGNFVKTMLRLAKERDSLRIVADQIGAPTTTELIARVTMQILTKADSLQDSGGLYHLTSAGASSWHGYAQYIVQWCADHGVVLKVKPDAVIPITTNEYPLPAKRPKNSRLNTDKIRQTFGVSLPDWQQGIDLLLKQITQD